MRKCQLRQQKCYPLEPVQEDTVSKLDEPPRKPTKLCNNQQRFKRKGLLTRLRDGYVRLMNDMALSADMTGVSAVYGCSTGQVDYPGMATLASMRSAKDDEEIEQAQMAARQRKL